MSAALQSLSPRNRIFPDTGSAYLAARLRVMSDRLVDDAFLLRLIRADHSELRGMLQSIHVDLFESESLDDNAALFQILLRALIRDFLILQRPLTPAHRALFRHWLRRYDLRNVKTIIRGRLNRQEREQIRPNLLDLSPFEQMDVENLLAAEDVAELLRALDATPFAGLARQARAAAGPNQHTYRLDAGLDQFYYGRLLRSVREAQAEDQAALSDLLGRLVDHMNLLWLLRFRFSYRLAPAETYYLLVNGSRVLTRRHLLSLVEEPDLPSVLENLPLRLKRVVDGAKTIMEVENRLTGKLRRDLFGIYRGSYSPTTRALAYLMLREQDTDRLRAVMRGRLLGLDEVLIREALNLPAEGGE